MVRAIYPGSFDPATYGHLDIIRRAAALFDEVIVGVLNNSAKSPLFSVEERVNILENITKDVCNAKVIIRGLRAITDFEYELQMAQTNRVLDRDVDTMFLTTSLEYAYLSSTTVKEAAYFGADISKFVPEYVVRKVEEKFRQNPAR